jgi:hypothetical protein
MKPLARTSNFRWYGTATDIGDRKRAEEEIRKESIGLPEEIIY